MNERFAKGRDISGIEGFSSYAKEMFVRYLGVEREISIMRNAILKAMMEFNY